MSFVYVGDEETVDLCRNRVNRKMHKIPIPHQQKFPAICAGHIFGNATR